MTDSEIIFFKAEIDRRMKCLKNERNSITKASDNNLSLGARIAMCEEILSFTNSMKEEPASNKVEVSYDAKLNEAHRLGREEGMFFAKMMFKEPVARTWKKLCNVMLQIIKFKG